MSKKSIIHVTMSANKKVGGPVSVIHQLCELFDSKVIYYSDRDVPIYTENQIPIKAIPFLFSYIPLNLIQKLHQYNQPNTIFLLRERLLNVQESSIPWGDTT